MTLNPTPLTLEKSAIEAKTHLCTYRTQLTHLNNTHLIIQHIRTHVCLDVNCVGAIWRQRPGSTLLAHVMACCLSAPSPQSLNSEALWHSPESNFTVSAQATGLYNEFGNYIVPYLPGASGLKHTSKCYCFKAGLLEIYLEMRSFHLFMQPK